MVDQDEFSGWERVDMLPDGRYLLADSQKGTRVTDADGTNFMEPSASEIVALRSLLAMRFQKKVYWNRQNECEDDELGETLELT
jgi:hypothetical protein